MSECAQNSQASGPGEPPLSISVVVLTHNRLDTLRRCLTSLSQQRPANFETIVIDNGSPLAVADTIRREFPDVRLIALGENTGIRGRNEGFRAASGDIIVSLDDDIELLDPGSVARLLVPFQRHADLGALTLKLTEAETGDEFPIQHWWHPLAREHYQDSEFQTDRLNEAAAVFRATALRTVGYYYEKLFWGSEELDLVLGLIDAGYQIRYFPEPVAHLAPRGDLNRAASPRHALQLRNRCWVALRRLPLWHALAFCVPRLALWCFRSVRHGYPGAYVKAVVGLARAMPDIVRDRKTVSARTMAELRRLRTQSAPDARSRTTDIRS